MSWVISWRIFLKRSTLLVGYLPPLLSSSPPSLRWLLCRTSWDRPVRDCAELAPAACLGTSSGSFAIFAAMRRVSFAREHCAAARRPGSFSK